MNTQLCFFETLLSVYQTRIAVSVDIYRRQISFNNDIFFVLFHNQSVWKESLKIIFRTSRPEVFSKKGVL